jgi:hypothetical protein
MPRWHEQGGSKMIDKMAEVIKLAQGAVFGWRKLGVLIGILVAQFVWLFVYTVKGQSGAIVPDLPVTFAGTTVILYLTFVVGNWGEHKAKSDNEEK